jgi:outer membrane protein assembly factor BamB
MLLRFIFLSYFTSICWVQAEPQELAQKILEATQVQGGLVIHLGYQDVAVTAALRKNASYLVQGLGSEQSKIDADRIVLRQQGVYGPVCLEKLAAKTLPYLDNLVNLVVVEDAMGVSDAEIQRVLTPGGAAYVKSAGDWKCLRKERPKDMDDWTHYLHGADGNPVAHDNHVGPPAHMQWVGSPRWSRHHDRMSSLSAMVSAGGRLFYIMDEGSRISIMLPPQWQLVARDAFNGMVLWRQDIKDWQNHLWPLKSGPTQLTRRLVAVGQHVFATMAFKAPVSRFNAATGELQHVYAGSGACEEILVEGQHLLTLVNTTGKHELDDYKYNNMKEVVSFTWDETPRDIVMFDVATGRELWRLRTPCAPLSLCLNQKVVVFHNGKNIIALERATGKELWQSELAERKAKIQFNFGPRLIALEDVILFAGGEGTMSSYDPATGKKMWDAPHAKSGYQSPHDLLVAKGLVWNAPNTGTDDSGVLTGRDLRTGQAKIEFPPTVDTYWFHHRCYISKATDNFMLMSRTGVEFIDFTGKNWDINHWVRGACLYGVMPANGLTYAPPHNCACFPETKVYGLNALAAKNPARATPSLNDTDEGRFEKGPAYEDPFTDAKSNTAQDWPTYRSTVGRTGFSRSQVPAQLAPQWECQLGGKLTATSIADGKVFVAQVEAHTLHALDATTGDKLWHYTTGGRIDSPPTLWKGRAVFGCADGWVYCLRMKDGALVWRFRGAPRWERHMAFEGLESVWPVHGSVLVEDGVASFIAGRSNFLDGGLRFIKVDVESGSKLVETSIDDKDPETGGDMQDKSQTLQMPAGLADILVSDGKWTYLKSQRFSADGQRPEVKVTSGNPVAQGSDQQGEGAHVYAPMGFLDDSWFHRSYWVYGKNFSGGHNGYHLAGKFTPSGRIMCVDDKNVYAFARKPQYYKWTTPLEHRLFSAPKEAPKPTNEQLSLALQAGNPRKKTQAKVAPGKTKGKGKYKTSANESRPALSFKNNAALDPSNQALTVEAWFKTDLRSGMILSHGGANLGYALVLREGKPSFIIRSGNKQLSAATATEAIDNGWHHVAGVMDTYKKIKLYVDGKLSATATSQGLLPRAPKDGVDIGADDSSKVSDAPAFAGSIDALAISHSAISAEALAKRSGTPGKGFDAASKVVMLLTFDQSNAADTSSAKNRGELAIQQFIPGKDDQGMALRLASEDAKAGPGSNVQMPQYGYFVEPHWNKDVPIIVRGMAMAQQTVFIAGAEDVIDEEDAVARMTKGDESILPLVKQMAENLDGLHGAKLLSVNAADGQVINTVNLPSPPVWDGMSAAQGCLFVSTLDGRVMCLGK